jgi:ACT domain-containing protein
MAKKRKTAKRTGSQICIVTVTGVDKVGIIARLSSDLAAVNINIVDVNQKIMLARTARQLQLSITCQHENIFKMMHRV